MIDTTDAVALVFDAEDGTLFDCTYNWESAQTYAREFGYIVIAVADDGSMDADAIQRLCDYERDIRIDCFGQ